MPTKQEMDELKREADYAELQARLSEAKARMVEANVRRELALKEWSIIREDKKRKA